ncbi:MAG: choline kinase [Candidatus Sericytochromatia bacterium]
MKLNNLEDFILSSTNSKEILSFNKIQSLWSDYGEILKVNVKGNIPFTLIIKNIVLPQNINTDNNFSHQRKIKSYDNEINWYKYFSNVDNNSFKFPKCFGIKKDNNSFVLIIEDLDSLGYPVRLNNLNKKEAMLCLKWLANFHAYFINTKSEYLWEIGTYWHLATRPDEFLKMKDSKLKEKAHEIDFILNNCSYKTLVHGDSKTANFCFSSNLNNVSAVDFQYVGHGCGMKDIAYFFDSAFIEKQCFDWEEELLDYYFKELNLSCTKYNKEINFSNLENEWRRLYSLCWADFYRFLIGWIPNTNVFNDFNTQLIDKALKLL